MFNLYSDSVHPKSVLSLSFIVLKTLIHSSETVYPKSSLSYLELERFFVRFLNGSL